jgi:hypothetical protein
MAISANRAMAPAMMALRSIIAIAGERCTRGAARMCPEIEWDARSMSSQGRASGTVCT